VTKNPRATGGVRRDAVAVEPTADDPEAEERSRRARRLKRHEKLAESAEYMAETADNFAATLEEAAKRGDVERRLAVASVEREVARIARRNAAKLRDPINDHPVIEELPHLPQFGTPAEDSISGTPSGEAS
jgi:hypothetical protein